MKKMSTTIDDTATLRAFVMPDLFPFLLEVYTKEGKDEEALKADIKLARDKYKELVASKKPQASVKRSSDILTAR